MPLRIEQIKEYFESNAYEDFDYFERSLYTCVVCGALVTFHYRGIHAEWHEWIARDDDE